MHVWRLLFSAAVFLGLVTSGIAEVVYSGVRSIGFAFTYSELPLDLDGDGAADFGITYSIMQTADIPPSATGGQVSLQVKGAHRVLVAGNNVAALPDGYVIQAQPANNFTWAGAADRPYGISAGSWGQTRNTPWSGWQGFAAAADPVFGVELHSAAGTRFAWVRLRFSRTSVLAGGSVYDWAYESVAGQPITARQGSNGALTQPPRDENTPRPIAFVARLAGSKAVPPNSNPLTAAASIGLTGNNLSVGITVPSDGAHATDVIVQGRGEELTISLTSAGVAIHQPGSTDGSATDPGWTYFAGSASIRATLAQAIRDGEAHLLLPLAGGALRGQIAQPLPEPPPVEPQPLTGSYTLLLRPQQESTEGEARPMPTGVGYGQLHFSESRSAALDATLPLGARLRWRGMLAADGTLLIDAPIRQAQGGGSVKGALTVTRSGAKYFVSGTLTWRRPPGAEGTRYPAGFNVALSVEGVRHTNPQFRSSSYLLSLTGGPLQHPISVSLLAVSTPRVIPSETGVYAEAANPIDYPIARTSLQIAGANPHKVTIYLEPATGIFRGTFRDPGTRRLVPFAGRMLAGSDNGAGAFISLRKSGAISISPITQLRPPHLASVVPHTLTLSTTDPDVVMVSASSLVPDTSYVVELVARPVSMIPEDGIYDFDLVRRRVAGVGLTVVTERTTTIALQRNASFRGVRVHGGWFWGSGVVFSVFPH